MLVSADIYMVFNADFHSPNSQSALFMTGISTVGNFATNVALTDDTVLYFEEADLRFPIPYSDISSETRLLSLPSLYL